LLEDIKKLVPSLEHSYRMIPIKRERRKRDGKIFVVDHERPEGPHTRGS